jgi:hypothetical protein
VGSTSHEISRESYVFDVEGDHQMIRQKSKLGGSGPEMVVVPGRRLAWNKTYASIEPEMCFQLGRAGSVLLDVIKYRRGAYEAVVEPIQLTGRWPGLLRASHVMVHEHVSRAWFLCAWFFKRRIVTTKRWPNTLESTSKYFGEWHYWLGSEIHIHSD